jgi:flagellar hook-basal body complex protein FliE
MALSPFALSAYRTAMNQAGSINAKVSNTLATKPTPPSESFVTMLKDSIQKVNNLQNTKNDMIQEFASGQSENVHDLMINLQKASLAMQMTTTVRGKVLDAYKELVKMTF